MKLYKFYSATCVPCARLSRILESLILPDGVELVPINVHENYEFSKEHGVVSVPTLMFEDGRKLVGLKTPREILEFIGGQNDK